MSYTRTHWVESETPLSAQNMNNIEDGIEELQNQKVDQESGKALSTNDYTTAEKTKLAGIEAGAEVNVQANWTQTTTTADDYIKNKPGNATTSAAGFMSAADKTKLNGIAAGAEVNQNAFSNVKVGSSTIAADGKTDTLELVAGNNVVLAADTANDKVTIATNNANIVVGTSEGDSDEATTNGNTYLILREGFDPISRRRIAGSGATTVTSNASGHITINSTNTTYSAATSSAAGLMSAADKSKLNLIAERANQVVMDKFTINNISVTTRSTTTGNYSVSKSGYTLLGIVGFYFEDSTPAVVADTWKFIEVSRLYPDNNKIYYSITLNTPSTITSAVKLNVYCLYMK